VTNRRLKASDRRFVLPASLFEPYRRLLSSPRYWVAAFLIMMSGAPVLASQPETARSAVERAIKVMGGDAVLTSVQTLQTHERHTAYRLTDSDHPEGPFLDSPTEATKYMELRHQRMVTQLDIRLPTGDEQVATVIYRGSESESRSTWNGKPSPTQLVAAPQNWDLGNPIIVLQASLAAPDLKIAGTSRLYGMPHTLVRFTHDGQPVTLELNDYNGYLDGIMRRTCTPSNIANSIWGDYELRTLFGDWRLEQGGLHYPFLATSYFNGTLQDVGETKDLEINPQASEFAQIADSPVDPQGVQNPRDVDDIPLSNLDTKGNGNPGTGPVEIAPGVLQIPGNWYTTVVRQPDGLVIIDAPISSGYSKQVMEEAKRRFPNLPIKAVVTSTSYWWHFAGIREYAAQGIPIYVLDVNESLIRSALQAPHLTYPDELARSGRTPKLLPVSKPTTIGSGPNKIVLYPVRSATGQMMMTWFPESHLLYTAEMAQPLGPNHTFLFPQSLWELMESVKSNQLPVGKIIGMHMSPTQWSLLVKTVDAALAGEPPPKLHD
jgi:hypothetical protein